MHLSNSALRAELGSCLEGLQEALSRFGTHVLFHARDAWLWAESRALGKGAAAFAPAAEMSRQATLEGIVKAVQAIKYETELQDAHESMIAPGLVVLPKEGLRLADEVNRRKGALASVLRAMSDRTEMGVIDQRTGERGRRPLREVALEAFYFRRLHHWQATRRIEILRENPEFDSEPEYVGFMWATSRDVRRTTREELLKLAEAPNARLLSEEEIDTVRELPQGEPLAIVRPGHTSPKVNVRWPARPGKASTSRVRMAVLPIVMHGERLPVRLRRLPPAPTPKHFRLDRIDTEVESEPLLGSMPVYRYLEHLRAQKRHTPGSLVE